MPYKLVIIGNLLDFHFKTTVYIVATHILLEGKQELQLYPSLEVIHFAEAAKPGDSFPLENKISFQASLAEDSDASGGKKFRLTTWYGACNCSGVCCDCGGAARYCWGL